jgi:hypothetical protein
MFRFITDFFDNKVNLVDGGCLVGYRQKSYVSYLAEQRLIACNKGNYEYADALYLMMMNEIIDYYMDYLKIEQCTDLYCTCILKSKEARYKNLPLAMQSSDRRFVLPEDYPLYKSVILP